MSEPNATPPPAPPGNDVPPTPAGTDARLAALETALAPADVGALLVGPGADLRYLTGYSALEMERLTLLVVRADGRARLVVPTLERPRAEAAGLPPAVEVVDVGETGDPFTAVVDALGDAATERLGVGDRLWSTFLLRLQDRLPSASWIPASTVTRELRMVKDDAELDALRRAGQAIDRVHARVPSLLAPGRTEAEVGRDIARAIVEEGHDEVAFVIVASGPNGASPHHETSDRVLGDGDAVVVDIGGFVDGYASDCTRSYVVGEPPDGYLDAHAALVAAQEAAVAAVRPGIAAEAVDAAARSVLADAGLAEAFVHRLGHGIGLEVHEDPYLVAGNSLPLRAGMTFSVEPGVYLQGRYGMRVEDIVVVTDDGAQRLNLGPREPVPASGTA